MPLFVFIDYSCFALVTKQLLLLTNEVVRLSEACFERGVRPACEVETGAFDSRTTFCRSGSPVLC